MRLFWRQISCYLTILCLLSGVVRGAAYHAGTAKDSRMVMVSDTVCDSGAAEGAEYDGYLVRLDTGSRLLSAQEADIAEIARDLEEVYAPEGLYLARDGSEIRRLREAGVLEYAEPNYIITLDDPELEPLPSGGEAGLLDDENPSPMPTNWEDQWYMSAMGMEYCQKRGITGKGIRIGIVDSGVNRDHWDLRNANILSGTNYCVPENDPNRHETPDDYGHGTFVAGLIAAGSEGGGIAGLAPDVEIVPLKAFSGKRGSVANVIQAIKDGVEEYECQILNLSLGITSSSSLNMLHEAVTQAWEQGVVIAAAAGNLGSGQAHGANGDPLNYPAAFDEVIGVAAVGPSRIAAAFSYQNESVMIAAPGQSLRSLAHDSEMGYVSGGGTSYASPFIAAAAALALSVRPDMTPGELMKALCEAAWDLGEPGYDTTYGNGLIHIGSFLTSVRGDVGNRAAFLADELEDAAVFVAEYTERGAMNAVRRVLPYDPEADPGDAEPIPDDGEPAGGEPSEEAASGEGSSGEEPANGDLSGEEPPIYDDPKAEADPHREEKIAVCRIFALDSLTLAPLRGVIRMQNSEA